jgi:glycosyltransferase involved in cell wall biosynthesis
MTDVPLVSVVLPVYNGALTLSSAVHSILEQTFQEYELLILDDGSKDESVGIAKTFSDPRICVIHNGANRGLASRLNQGIDLARGRYIARMDQDDICFPERLAKQREFLEAHPEIDLLGCRTMVFGKQLDVVGLTPFRRTHEEICAHPWQGLYLAHPSWMGRTKWFRHYHYRIPEAFLADDQELLLRAYPESRFACLEEVLLAYRKEHFHLRKTWRTRKALLKVQVSHFIHRHQWNNVMLSVLCTVLKTSVDCTAFVTGNKGPFFRQIDEPAPDALIQKFRRFVNENGLRDESGE